MSSSDSLEQLVSREVQRGEVRERALREREGSPSSAPVLTVSRDYFCGGETLAKDLADRLGWALIDRTVIDRIAADRHADPRAIERVDEAAFSFLHEWCNEIFVPGYLGQVAYMVGLVKVLMDVANEGSAVVVGRGANFLIPTTRRLAVRLTASADWRVRKYSTMRSVSLREAERAIREEDARRSDFVRRHVGRDLANPLHYDLVLNMQSLPLDAAAGLVISALEARFDLRPSSPVAPKTPQMEEAAASAAASARMTPPVALADRAGFASRHRARARAG